MRKQIRLLLAALVVAPVAAHAAPVTYSGYLDNASSLSPAGGTLVDYLLGPPDLVFFPDQNVALFEFTVAAPSSYTVTSRGYNDVYGNAPNIDGFDTYIAIFQGSGNTAGFLEEFSNPVGPGDFQAVTAPLAAGTYTLAISMWNNYACGNGACSPSTGTLGDGFSGLSNPEVGRELYFEVDLEARGQPVPEPSAAVLLLSAGAALGAHRLSARWRATRHRRP